MALRRYPHWDTPEIEEWDDRFPDDYYQRCFPFGALAIAAVGAFALCRPRRSCSPRSFYDFDGCSPYYSCTPTHICYPRRPCLPYA